jgi:hypothetical protein
MVTWIIVASMLVKEFKYFELFSMFSEVELTRFADMLDIEDLVKSPHV